MNLLYMRKKYCSHTIYEKKYCSHTVYKSHDTIHPFKNYFVTVFLVFNFSKNKLYPNKPLIAQKVFPRHPNYSNLANQYVLKRQLTASYNRHTILMNGQHKMGLKQHNAESVWQEFSNNNHREREREREYRMRITMCKIKNL